jgi:hypothetical protein
MINWMYRLGVSSNEDRDAAGGLDRVRIGQL